MNELINKDECCVMSSIFNGMKLLCAGAYYYRLLLLVVSVLSKLSVLKKKNRIETPKHAIIYTITFFLYQTSPNMEHCVNQISYVHVMVAPNMTSNFMTSFLLLPHKFFKGTRREPKSCISKITIRCHLPVF